MDKSQAIAELAKALANFQKTAKTIGFDKSNPYFKSKYATLTALVEGTKKDLAENGLTVSQLVEGEGGITTILMHTSGEFLSSMVTLKPVKDDPQGRGSAITYARRYAYAAILGLVSDEDDDGNEASKTSPKLTTGVTIKAKEAAKQTTPVLLEAQPLTEKEEILEFLSTRTKADEFIFKLSSGQVPTVEKFKELQNQNWIEKIHDLIFKNKAKETTDGTAGNV